MLAAGFQAIVSHWRRKPLQLSMLLLGLALSTALWSAVQAINGEARASYARAAAVVGQDKLESLRREDGAKFSQEIFIALRREGILVSPILEGEKRFGGERLRIIGIDPLTLPPEASQADVMSEGIGLARFVQSPGLLLVSAETASRLPAGDVPPVQAAQTVPPGTALADIGIAQTLLGTPGLVSRLVVWPGQQLDMPTIARIAPGLVLKPPAAESDLARLTDSFHLNLTAFGFLSFAVGFFIVHSAVGLAFEQRRPVFRTLRALGLPSRSLVLLLVVELLTLACLAGLAGVAMGYGVASILLPDVAASLRGLYGADLPGTLSIRPSVWAAGLMIAIGGTLVSASASFWRLWTMPLLAPARPRAWSLASERSIRLQFLAGIALLILAAFLAWLGSSLLAGFACLGALLLGAALMLPALLSILLKLAERPARGALAQWFWADTRQQLPGLSLALMALLLALAANSGVGTMVESFRLTFRGWLDQRLASELYVTTRSNQASDQVRAWLQDRADAVLPIWNAEATVKGAPVQIYGIVDHATYRDNWPLLQQSPEVWDTLAAGKGALVNEQFSRRNAASVGDTVKLDDNLSLPIAGVFSDYGNPKGQIVISNDLLKEHYPDASRLRYAVRIPPDKVAKLEEELQSAFGLPAENMIDQASVKAFSLKIFERTFAVTGALNVLTLGVAGLAMLASLLTLSAMRLTQLAPVWAMGLPLRRLALLELLRSLVLAGFTFIAAIPVGLALAWVLLAVVNVQAFGWRLPLHVFPAEWLRLLALSGIAAGLAALLPAWRLVKIPPAELVKIFAHER